MNSYLDIKGVLWRNEGGDVVEWRSSGVVLDRDFHEDIAMEIDEFQFIYATGRVEVGGVYQKIGRNS